jgi:ParB/RepB/Spo0J family partition protein
MSDAFFSKIPLSSLVPNDYNARRFVENMTPQRQAKFNELVISIRDKGIIEPLLVRPMVGNIFEVIAGERRYRAALEVAGDPGNDIATVEIPCMVRDVNDDDAFDLMVVENLQREDLTPMEVAQAFKAFLDRHGKTTDSVAELQARTGIPAHAIRRQVRLLELPAEILEAWKSGGITQSHVEMFTRVADRTQSLELLSACVRSKLTVKELAERIGGFAPDLDRGFFSKGECQTCPYNSAVQSSLFVDFATYPGAKCGNPLCFENKQSAFLEENWSQSKAAKEFGTRGFVFGHRHQGPVEMIITSTAERCLDCDQFVSMLRLTGAVISGYAKTCIGPAKCFEELYRGAPAATESKPFPPKETPQEITHEATETETAEKSDEEALDDAAPAPGDSAALPDVSVTESAKTATEPAKTKPAASPVETSPVFDSMRGNKYREEYIKANLPGKLLSADPDSSQVKGMILIALISVSREAKQSFNDHVDAGNPLTVPQMAKIISEDMLEEEVWAALKSVAGAQLMASACPAAARRIVADSFGVHMSDWSMTKPYLTELNKSEIVRIAEEPGVKVWGDEKLKAYRKKKYQGKALLSLKKEELIDLILNSGADLAGRVPAEIIGR